jgi:hypothetical protein
MEGLMLIVFLFLIAVGVGNLVKNAADNPETKEAGLNLLKRLLK